MIMLYAAMRMATQIYIYFWNKQKIIKHVEKPLTILIFYVCITKLYTTLYYPLKSQHISICAVRRKNKCTSLYNILHDILNMSKGGDQELQWNKVGRAG